MMQCEHKHDLGRVDTKPNNTPFRQNFTHPAPEKV